MVSIIMPFFAFFSHCSITNIHKHTPPRKCSKQRTGNQSKHSVIVPSAHSLYHNLSFDLRVEERITRLKSIQTNIGSISYNEYSPSTGNILLCPSCICSPSPGHPLIFYPCHCIALTVVTETIAGYTKVFDTCFLS